MNQKITLKTEKGEYRPLVIAVGLGVALLGLSQLLALGDKELSKLKPQKTQMKAYEFVMPDINSFSLVEAIGKQSSAARLPSKFVSKLFLPTAPKPKVVRASRPKPKPKPNPVVTPPKPKPPKTDYRGFVRDRVSLSGLSNTGVFINGRFYQAGDKLDIHYKHEARGRVESPVIQNIEGNTVVLNVSGKRLVIKRRKDG